MKNPHVFILLLFAALIIPLNLDAQTEKDMKAIKEVVKQYEDALNRNSLDDVVAVFTLDAVVLPPDAPAASGHRAIRDQYKGVTDPGTSIDITLEIQELILSDDIAHVWSLNYGTVQFEGGDKSKIDSKSLMVLQKTLDGWKASRYMFNSNNAPE